MINLTTIAFALFGIILGAVITGLIFKSKNSTTKANLENANRMLEETKRQSQVDLQEAKDNFDQRLADMKADEQRHYESALAAKDKANEDALNAIKDNYDKAIKDQEERHNKAIKNQNERLDTSIKAATEEMLKARQKEFTESSNESIGQLVNPLKENIAELKKAMEAGSKEQAERSGEMRQQIKSLMEHSDAARKSADELAATFKHGSKVQGDWGETVLAKLLESQGLTEGIHFDTQATIRDSKGETVKNEEGQLLRPDVILHLDKKREVIIDSKVSLTAFYDYVNAEDETARQKYLKSHIESVQKHVKELSKKDYSSYIQPPKVKMDYVIMFMPHTGALWTALKAQPDLWRNAMEQNVYIADEQTLYAALKMIQLTWTQIKQAQNHEEVYRLASEIVDRVGLFVKKYDEVGIALSKAQKAFDDGKKKLEDRGQSIVLSANKIIKLGAKQNPDHPVPELIDIEDVESLVLPQKENDESNSVQSTS